MTWERCCVSLSPSLSPGPDYKGYHYGLCQTATCAHSTWFRCNRQDANGYQVPDIACAETPMSVSPSWVACRTAPDGSEAGGRKRGVGSWGAHAHLLVGLCSSPARTSAPPKARRAGRRLLTCSAQSIPLRVGLTDAMGCPIIGSGIVSDGRQFIRPFWACLVAFVPVGRCLAVIELHCVPLCVVHRD